MADSQKPMANSQAARAMAIAESKLGAPYVWATAGPDTFDCSGFTWWVASQVLGPLDYELRSSHHQFNVWGDPVAGGTPPPKGHPAGGGEPGGELQRGDLVFFDVGQGVIMGNRAGHVGFALGDGRMIHAANEESGVIHSDLANPWYAQRFIGARRIFGQSRSRGVEKSRSSGLRVPEGAMRTLAPWNGVPIGADWGLIGRWSALIESAAVEYGLDPRQVAAVMALETQGIHARGNRVLEVWDGQPEDGPSVGIMQVKPRLWGWLRPDLDPYTVDGNIRLGAAVLRELIDRYGSFEAALARGYHPGVAANGTTPESYVMAARSLLRELGAA